MPAPKPDFGPCPQCGTNNSYAAATCRTCGAVLPWAKHKGASGVLPPQFIDPPSGDSPSVPRMPPPNVYSGPPQGRSAPSQRSTWRPGQSAPKQSSIDWGYFGVMFIAFLFPCIGFFMWRSYNENGGENGSAAAIGTALGFTLGILLRFVWHVV